MKTLRVVMALLVVFQLPVNSMPPRSAFGSSRTQSTVTESPPRPPESDESGKRWPSRPASQPPGWDADPGGLSGDRHRPEESDLLEEGHDNSTEIVSMDHAYYTSKITGPGDAGAADAWVNAQPAKGERWKTSGFLSGTRCRAERVNLSFDFPFYGHMLKEVTVAPAGKYARPKRLLPRVPRSVRFPRTGFIYTGELVHRLLTATQYIAPLMAHFDPALAADASVFYFDNGSALVVQWRRLHLQDRLQSGTFTFQAALHADGRIVFAYREIPVDIRDIGSENHPVKVGLSDAFVVLHKIEQIPNLRRRTIYEYHKVEIVKSKICNATTIEMLPLPTCLQFSGCAACVTSQIGFNCSWCSRLQRCSSGFDRKRQDWVDHGCQDQRRDLRCLSVLDARSRQPTPGSGGKGACGPSSSASQPAAGGEDRDTGQRKRAGLLAGAVAVAAVTVVTVTGVLLSVYAYNRPTSTAGLFFMERRPARWPTMKFRRGSGRPSYAEVEPPGADADGAAVIDPKRSLVMDIRRESEQKEGFVVPDPRERFLCCESA
ncbi:plexin domain-containing protein 2-like [Hippocampus zosterae]|uniref:plexin domain-containing protein 2-like n=1 Tax=Hippocampus zosterae TaxID=109293 RepID=UPI00223D0619|nr:plexin domain-containing protein 2-like [Hippocampus zosterae]